MFPIKGNTMSILTVACVLTFASLLFQPVISGAAAYGLRDDEFPSVVHLEITGDPREVAGCCPRCSGVLISLKHVTTVASCLWSMSDGKPNAQNIQVFAGTSEVSGRMFNGEKILPGFGACSRSVQIARARGVIYHPQFSPQFNRLRYDVAIVVVPTLQATRFVNYVPASFDMFEGGMGISKECKIVGFGILNFPRGGYYNLLTWLQPLTRWARAVAVTNGCMGKPRDLSSKKWANMVEGGLCSKVFSSEPHVCWNDKGAALICNGKLAGLVQGQYEDRGKLDMELRQCPDSNTTGAAATGHASRQQIIFFNVKYLAEFITNKQMDGTRDLQWTDSEDEMMIGDLVLALSLSARDSENGTDTSTNSSTNLELSKDEGSDNSSQESTTSQSKQLSQPSGSSTTRTSGNTTNPPSTTEWNTVLEGFRNMAFDDLPELEMDLVTDQDFGEFNVDSVINENNPFNASWSQIHHLAIVLNPHLHTACTGVFISPHSLLTGASCLVRKEEKYIPQGVASYRVITGHSNGMVDFCSDRIQTYAVQNVTLLNKGLRQQWQMYRKSRIAPYTEIYNLAVLTIVGAHLDEPSYKSIDNTTWLVPATSPSDEANSSQWENSDYSDVTVVPLKCRMFGYGHEEFPYTNQKDRIGIKYLELDITENCSRPLYDLLVGEQSENLWLKTENPHFLCSMDLSPDVGPSAGSIGSPLYCGPENKLVGVYIGRYNNRSFESYWGPKPRAEISDSTLSPEDEAESNTAATSEEEDSKSHSGPRPEAERYVHVFLKLADYEAWISDVLLDERYVQLRLARLSRAPPMRGLDLVYMCVLAVMPRLLVSFGWV